MFVIILPAHFSKCLVKNQQGQVALLENTVRLAHFHRLLGMNRLRCSLAGSTTIARSLVDLFLSRCPSISSISTLRMGRGFNSGDAGVSFSRLRLAKKRKSELKAAELDGRKRKGSEARGG